MEVWSLYMNDVYTDEEYQEQLDSDGRMDCRFHKEQIGLFPTRERALLALGEMSDDPFESARDLYCAFVRERAMCCMMNVGDYLHEWTYHFCELLDESLVRNYCERENPFLGRPKDKIRFSHGDIVMVPEAYSGHWGIVCEVPPTDEQVLKINNHIEKKTGTSGFKLYGLDWNDDNYIILTSDEGSACHEHILAHHVLPAPLHGVPAFVEKKLKEGLRKADEEPFMFTLIKTNIDLNRQINNTPIYYSQILKVENIEYWLQYCHMSWKKAIRYEIGGELYGCAAVQLIKKENDNLYSVYKYHGTLVINRHLHKNNVIFDDIENIKELEMNIKKYLNEHR